MQFSELSNREKAEYTFNQIQKKKAALIKGKKEAQKYVCDNSYKIKSKLRGEKRVCMRDFGG